MIEDLKFRLQRAILRFQAVNEYNNTTMCNLCGTRPDSYSRLKKGHLEFFSPERLYRFCENLGLEVTLEIHIRRK